MAYAIYCGPMPLLSLSPNASGMRDTAWVLRVSTDTVLRELWKQAEALEAVNSARLHTLNSNAV